MLDPQTGTITVDDGATTAIIAGLNLSDFRTGDSLSAGASNRQDIASVNVGAGTVTLYLPWSGGDLDGAACVLRPDAPSRFDAVVVDQRTLRVLALIEAQPFQYTVPPGGTPGNDLGENGNAAIRWFPFPLKWFEKVDGVWQDRGTPIGYNQKGDYADDVTYRVGDVAKDAGKVYVWINATPGAGHRPPNATYWQLVVENGDMYDVATFDTDRPASNELVVKWVAPRHTLFPADLGDTAFHAEIGAAENAVYRFYRNATSAMVSEELTETAPPFGTVTFHAGQLVAVNVGAETAFEKGDVLRVYAPALRDETLGGIAGTIAAFR